MNVSRVKLLALGILIFLAGSASAQSLTISGKVVDKVSKEPLSFASIGIKGKTLGTISNAQGEFDFHFPNELRNDILVINMLGYETFEAPVWTLLPDVHDFELERSTTFLQEVVITDSLTGGDIIRSAIARIDENYPDHPFELDAFYRDIKKVGGSYISLLEAAVKVYDESYAEPRNKLRLHERVNLVEVRQSLGYESKFTSYFDKGNLLEQLLLGNYVRYRQIGTSDDFLNSLVREKDTYYDGHEVFVVSSNKDYFIKFYVDKSDFSFVRLEHETVPGYVVDKRQGMIGKLMGLSEVIEFKRYEKTMYLNYMTMDSKVDWYDLKTNEMRFETELQQQLLVNNVNPDPEERITSTDRMRSYGLQFQNHAYNKPFWDNYNVIKETPLDKQILSDLERVGPLEKQFENN